MFPASPRRRHLSLFAATVAVAAVASLPGAAMASNPAACPDAAVSNPFAPWGDDADYQLAPEGDIEERASSWSLTGGAAAAEGNETYMVTSPTDHLSLRLPGSSSATSERMCIGAEHRTWRFFVKRHGGSTSSRLLVEVLFEDAAGRDRALPVGLISAAQDWAPSGVLPTLVNRLAPSRGNAIDVAFRFKPLRGGVWSIDDVYVDPLRGT